MLTAGIIVGIIGFIILLCIIPVHRKSHAKKEKEKKETDWGLVATWVIGVIGSLVMGFGNDKLSEFYVDTEKVCDIDCWVFDTKGWNNQYVKFWVDPSNGFALKMVATTTGSTYAVTEYNLNYTTWDSDFAPN